MANENFLSGEIWGDYMKESRSKRPIQELVLLTCVD